ncbi:MAG: NAD(P)H-hydrate dehydratase [Verrucomicrobia bacterium]|nr:NAD(P)H-hydrate dehydratase [Verrucomicrobiota bacterium]
MSLPVITVSQMREWEQATWAGGQTEAAVIARVGRAVAERVLQATRPGDAILVLAGKGNNGEDARQACPHLHERAVQLINITDPATAMTEVTAALAKQPAAIVDGLFGTGLNRPLEIHWAKLIEAVNKSELPVLAVDVPSGLNADSGEPQGAAIHAAVTLTVGAPKRGLVLAKAYPFVGRLEVAADIGLAPCPIRDELNWIEAEDFKNFPPRRAVGTNKGSFGHLVIIAGSLGYHGAAVLAAKAALRAKVGLVTVYTQPNVYYAVAGQLDAAMVRAWQTGNKLPESATAILIGPGLASGDLPPDLRQDIARLWQLSPLAVVVDASALDWLPAGPTFLGTLRFITPHPGEAGRMLKLDAAAVQAERVNALRELSRRRGDCWVALKGHQTLVGRGSGEISINSSGNPDLAQGGSGDVLAGYLAGIVAQPQVLKNDAGRAVRHAVWQHGAAADALSRRQANWTCDELLASLGNTAGPR